MKLLCVDAFGVKNGEAQISGVAYYRIVKPNVVLKRLGDFDFTLIQAINKDVSDELIKEYDLILFSRSMGAYDDVDGVAERLNKLGIPFGLDLDDHWELYPNHILTDYYKDHKVSEAIVKSIKHAHFVICTTDILAGHIKEHNPNVHIIENGIDTEDEAWQINKKESYRTRFGFTQGHTHFGDLQPHTEAIARSFKDLNFYKKGQIVLCGFDAEHDKPSIYVGYERLITNNLNAITDKFYTNRLKMLGRPDGDNKPYKRIWQTPVFEFGFVYDEIDISVAPLASNKFNSCKSELKMIEAGFKGCAVMVSDVNPYSPLMTKENSFSLSENSFYLWQRLILRNPNMWKDRALQLAEDVKRFDLKNLTQKRKELYESVVNL